MPAVPGFTPTPKPEPNSTELARLRQVERARKQRQRDKKRERLHDNHWANNPAATFEVPKRVRRANPWEGKPDTAD